MRVTNKASRILSLAAIALAGCATGHDGDVSIGGGQSPDPVVLDIPVAYVRGPLPEDLTDLEDLDVRELEQAKLLKVTGEHARGFRDHVLFALALGTGLREHEVLALDVGDITEDGSTVKRRITLRVFKRCTDRPAPQEIFLPDALHYKLGRLLAWKKRRGESLAPDAPLFVSRESNRLSLRMARTAFRRWQQRDDV